MDMVGEGYRHMQGARGGGKQIDMFFFLSNVIICVFKNYFTPLICTSLGFQNIHCID